MPNFVEHRETFVAAVAGVGGAAGVVAAAGVEPGVGFAQAVNKP